MRQSLIPNGNSGNDYFNMKNFGTILRLSENVNRDGIKDKCRRVQRILKDGL